MVLGISATCWNTTQVSLWGDAVSFPPNHPLSICPDKHLPPLRSVIPGCLHITVLRLISLKRQEKVHLPLETPLEWPRLSFNLMFPEHFPTWVTEISLRSSWGGSAGRKGGSGGTFSLSTTHRFLLQQRRVHFHNFKTTCIVIPVTLISLPGQFSRCYTVFNEHSSPNQLSEYFIINSSHFPAGAEVQEAWHGTFRG